MPIADLPPGDLDLPLPEDAWATTLHRLDPLDDERAVQLDCEALESGTGALRLVSVSAAGSRLESATGWLDATPLSVRTSLPTDPDGAILVLVSSLADGAGTARCQVTRVAATLPETEPGGCACASASPAGWLAWLALPWAVRRRYSTG